MQCPFTTYSGSAGHVIIALTTCTHLHTHRAFRALVKVQHSSTLTHQTNSKLNNYMHGLQCVHSGHLLPATVPAVCQELWVVLPFHALLCSSNNCVMLSPIHLLLVMSHKSCSESFLQHLYRQHCLWLDTSLCLAEQVVHREQDTHWASHFTTRKSYLRFSILALIRTGIQPS